MNQNQKAVINGLMTIAGCVTVIGVVIMLMDLANRPEVCLGNFVTSNYCELAPMQMRGVIVAGIGIVVLAGIFVTRIQMSKASSTS